MERGEEGGGPKLPRLGLNGAKMAFVVRYLSSDAQSQEGPKPRSEEGTLNIQRYIKITDTSTSS